MHPQKDTSNIVSISWTAPTTRTDGSFLPLSEIAGYRVYRGTDPNNLTLLIDTKDPSVTDLNTTETEPGTYYYAATTYDVYDIESTLSDIVSKTIT